jgi:hypothetical protein
VCWACTVSTRNTNVFSFYPGDHLAHGLPEVLRRYKEVAPNVKLSGPTSFAAIIYQALRLVANTGQYHILVILADGQVRGHIHNFSDYALGPSAQRRHASWTVWLLLDCVTWCTYQTRTLYKWWCNSQ